MSLLKMKTQAGGKREGSGRKPTGRKGKQGSIYITTQEWEDIKGQGFTSGSAWLRYAHSYALAMRKAGMP
jgi:hypothetical protein